MPVYIHLLYYTVFLIKRCHFYFTDNSVRYTKCTGKKWHRWYNNFATMCHSIMQFSERNSLSEYNN